MQKKNKRLNKENPQAFDILLEFLARIENNLHYLEKQKHIELTKDFLTDQITADDFSYSFIAIYEGICGKFDQIKIEESLELANFLKPSRPELGILLARIYGSCDSYSPDPEIEIAASDENELKKFAQSLLLKLQEE